MLQRTTITKIDELLTEFNKYSLLNSNQREHVAYFYQKRDAIVSHTNTLREEIEKAIDFLENSPSSQYKRLEDELYAIEVCLSKRLNPVMRKLAEEKKQTIKKRMEEINEVIVSETSEELCEDLNKLQLKNK